MKCVLNTGRTVPQGASVEHKGSEAYRTVASACFLNPVDMMMLGIENGDRVRVTSPPVISSLPHVPQREWHAGRSL